MADPLTLGGAMPAGAKSHVLRQAGMDPRRPIDAAWGASVRIALIDGAVDCAHPGLYRAHIGQLGDSASVRAADHATFCASVVVGAAADTGVCADHLLALCPGGLLLNLAVVSDEMLNGQLPMISVANTLAKAVRQAVQARCCAILFGVEIRNPQATVWRPLRDAIAAARWAGVLTILPAGNRMGPVDDSHCTWPDALVVGSLDEHGRPSVFSPRAAHAPNLVFAPGEAIPGAACDAGYTLRSGTSFAAAMVAGVVGLACALRPYQPAADMVSQLFQPPLRHLDGSGLFANPNPERERQNAIRVD